MNGTTSQPERAVALQPRRTRELLGVALELYGRHPLTLVALVAAMLVPMSILNWQVACHHQGCRITVLDGVVVSASWWTTIVWVVVPILLAAVFGALLAVTTKTITAHLADENLGLRGALREGLSRPGWLQVAVLVVGMLAAISLLSLPGMYLSSLDGPLPQLAVAANLLLIVAAGLYFGVRLAMSVPVAVVEGRGWPQALTRSWSLVHGHWGHVVATLLLAWLATGLVGALLAGLAAGPTGLLIGDGWLARTLLQAAVMSLVLPYFLVVWVLLYLDLRARKERLGLDTLRAELHDLGA